MKSAIRFLRTGFVGASLLVLVSSACKQESAPAPATTIEGSYQAKYINLSGTPTIVGYPINGQTLSLRIQSIAADNVRIDILAPPNGKYSPGQNLSYASVSLASSKVTGVRNTYLVSLTNSAGSCAANSLLIHPTGEIDYYFVPAGGEPCSVSRVRFAR